MAHRMDRIKVTITETIIIIGRVITIRILQLLQHHEVLFYKMIQNDILL